MVINSQPLIYISLNLYLSQSKFLLSLPGEIVFSVVMW